MTAVRLFSRHDREQLSRLVNAHVAAVTPGGSVPTATLLQDLERPWGEPVVGPWVRDLVTLVGIRRDRLVAAAHLRRYGDAPGVGPTYRNTGEILWLLCWPDELAAGRAVRDAGLAQLQRWKVAAEYADGTLPAPGVYGVSDAWPHIARLYREAGFDSRDGQTEIVLAGRVPALTPVDAPIDSAVTVRREVGPLGISFQAARADAIIGACEIDDDLARGGRNLAVAGWADICNHWVAEADRRRGVGTHLVARAASWLRLGGARRLMAYVIDDASADDALRYWARYGLEPINRTVRGWRRPGH